MTHVVHPRGPGLGDEQIAAALRALLREHRPQRFPTLTWLARHGPPGLAAAVRRTGGGGRWAQALGMPAAQPARWTDELIEAELRRVCAGARRWPSRAQFEAAGAFGVLRAVYRGHGSRWWAERLGLSTKACAADAAPRRTVTTTADQPTEQALNGTQAANHNGCYAACRGSRLTTPAASATLANNGAGRGGRTK